LQGDGQEKRKEESRGEKMYREEKTERVTEKDGA
jgi:hypothetical protein